MNLSVILFSITLAVATSVHAVGNADEKRLDEVAQRGAHIMPFDLEKTTHIFSKTAKGGLQQVMILGEVIFPRRRESMAKACLVWQN